MASHKISEKAWEVVSIDLFGPLAKKTHVLEVQDTMSRIPAVALLPITQAEPVIKAIDNVYTAYGVPKQHRTDNVRPFNSREFMEFSKSKGIELVYSSYPDNPRGNPYLDEAIGKGYESFPF